MATSTRAPKQWCLTRDETLSSFQAWKQNLLYILSLDSNFKPFLEPGMTWTKKTSANPTRGLTSDGNDIPKQQRRTANEKAADLHLMLGQIANFCPIIARNTFEKNSTSLNDIWQAIRIHFGFQTTGSHFLDLADIKLEPNEHAEDLYQRILSFTEDNLLTEGSAIIHHGNVQTEDEDLTPTLENWVVLTWLQLLHPSLPRLVKQKYGTELRNKTLASVKPEISQALPSLLDELQAHEEIKVLRTADYNRNKKADTTRAQEPSKFIKQRKSPSCPLCKAARRNYNHYLSKCVFLPDSDKKFMAKTRQICGLDSDSEDDTFDENDHTVNDCSEPAPNTAQTQMYRVGVKRSPSIQAFYKHHHVNVIIDSGAETNMVRESLARRLGVRISKSSQTALQADGQTPLQITGETEIPLTRNGVVLHLEALVVKDLDVDALGGIPFMTSNDISVRPARNSIFIQGTEEIKYGTQVNEHSIYKPRCALLRAPPVTTTIWPGDYLELNVPKELQTYEQLTIEPRSDTSKQKSQLDKWPTPDVTEQVAGKIRILNDTSSPQRVGKNEHICQSTPVVYTTNNDMDVKMPSDCTKPTTCSPPYSSDVQIDSDHQLSDSLRCKFEQLTREYDNVFNPSFAGYNGAVGPFKATVNMGPVQPPQRKGRLPQYGKDRLYDLQNKFDELESLGVFKRPEDIGVTVEYLNPSFLVKKPSGGSRLVTAFAEVGQYAKPQPSLMPDVESTLRTIASWQYIITTDLTSAFYQIPLDKDSMKYCGVATPYKGIRVYTRSAMGMPGSETALEELMSRVLGDLLHEGVITKLADDLYCGGDTPEAVLHNWKRVLQALSKCNLRLSAKKTSICPKSTSILGWTWSQGTLIASKHRVSTLASCEQPTTVRSMRAFIGAYKTLSRVIPKCASILTPLENAVAGAKSQDKLSWSDDLHTAFTKAQTYLQSHHRVTLPRSTDRLWIVTDASVKKTVLVQLYTFNAPTKYCWLDSLVLKQRNTK